MSATNRFHQVANDALVMQEQLVHALRLARKELDACQRVIHYARGFDPAYVNDAQAALKVADTALEKTPA